MRKNAKRRTSKRRQRGLAMVIALLSLMLLSAVGMGLMFMTGAESEVNQNFRDSQIAYFAARAGLEEARQRLMPGGDIAGPGAAPTTTTGIIYITNPDADDTIAPWTTTNAFRDTQLCWENFNALALTTPGASNWGTPCTTAPSGGATFTSVSSTSPGTGTARALPYKWVRITAKTNRSTYPFWYNGTTCASGCAEQVLCWDGTQQVAKPAGYTDCSHNGLGGVTDLTTVWRVTSLAQTANGSRRMMQMEVANDPAVVANAAVDSKDHVTLNGRLVVNGWDNCSCDCHKDGQGAVVFCNSRSGMTCDASRYGIYSANTVDNPNSSERITSGQTPAIAQNQPWRYNIDAQISRYKQQAVDARNAPYNWTCSAATESNPNMACGTRSGQTFGVPPNFPPDPPSNPTGPANMAYQITYLPGDTQLTGGAQGYGILMVDGDLDIHGGFQFYGLILVSGVVKFSGGGSDAVNIYGAVLAGRKSIDASDTDTRLGGSAVINFDYCALTSHHDPAPPNTIMFKELQF